MTVVGQSLHLPIWRCPVCPQKQPNSGPVELVEQCQNQTHGIEQELPTLDHRAGCGPSRTHLARLVGPGRLDDFTDEVAQAPRLARQRAARRASGDPQLRHLDLAMEIAPGGFRPRMPRRHQCASLILALAHLLDGNPVLSFGRNIKFLGRYLYGFLFICSLYCAEMFSAATDALRCRELTRCAASGH